MARRSLGEGGSFAGNRRRRGRLRRVAAGRRSLLARMSKLLTGTFSTARSGLPVPSLLAGWHDRQATVAAAATLPPPLAPPFSNVWKTSARNFQRLEVSRRLPACAEAMAGRRGRATTPCACMGNRLRSGELRRVKGGWGWDWESSPPRWRFAPRRVAATSRPPSAWRLLVGSVGSRWWFGWFFATGFHAVRRVSRSGRKTGDMQ